MARNVALVVAFCLAYPRHWGNAKEKRIMGWIIALIVGGIAGWLASMVMNRDASMGIFWNIVVGCIGSVVGNLLAGPLLGISGSVQEFYRPADRDCRRHRAARHRKPDPARTRSLIG
jgi:uncharacterized membrane protein YeaQ/YmgE (transglycosylase-associated protein family)